MQKINWGRVVWGGLLCWAVFNLIWVAAWFLFLQDEWTPVFAALGRPFQATPGLWVLWLALTLVDAVLAIWFYAALRPRYGPGPKTAILTGGALWLGSFITAVWVGRVLSFPASLVAIEGVASLAAFLPAVLAGASQYKEE